MFNNDGICAIKKEYIVKKKNASSILKHKLSDQPADEIDNKKEKADCSENEPKTKIKQKGQNKVRPKTFRDDKHTKPCPTIIDMTLGKQKVECKFNNCYFIHNPLEYLNNKPADIGKECHVFNLRGKCSRGISCRFGSRHINAKGFNLIDESKAENWSNDIINTLTPSLQTQLQKRTYDFDSCEKLVKNFDKRYETDKDSGVVTNEDTIKKLPKEKKNIDWHDKLYLSPLTTVGNLPFRRICKGFGVDITCGEMALCESLLKGLKQEWALVKKHISEDLFGAQICGNNAYMISKVAQVLEDNCEVDFVDLNLGCPIDLIYKRGGGCGMMHRLPALETTIKSASSILSVPFTVKMRTGVYEGKKIAHTIMPNVAQWGASMITLHGRSREARYTRLADWEYIESCAKVADGCPVFGNGDIMSYEDYTQRREIAPTVQGVMIGRGALIKPWIFTEIKEQKIWDISSNERFDILKNYTNYGLEHWGSDTQGVENTRKFLLEWLSFLYRYVPVGLLERPPQKINARPPTYFGRDDMETMMASGNCADWVKISEMLLGPVPDGFRFLPKHKANSY